MKEDLMELEKTAHVFEKAFKDTDSTEYWKVKTGIIGGKVAIEKKILPKMTCKMMKNYCVTFRQV